MDSGWLWCIHVGSSFVRTASLWWGNVANGQAMHVWGQEVYGKSLYLHLNFAVNFKLLLKRHGSLNVLKGGKGGKRNTVEQFWKEKKPHQQQLSTFKTYPHPSSHLMLTLTLQGRCDFHPHLTEKVTSSERVS